MRRVIAEFVHTDALQGLVHAAADLRRGNAKVFGRKRHIVLHDARNDLVVGILKHHADRPAHVKKVFLAARVHALDGHGTLRRHKNGVQELCKRGLAGTVVSEHGDERPRLDREADAGERVVPGVGIAEGYVIESDDGICHLSLPAAARPAGEHESALRDGKPQLLRAR